MTRPHLYIGDRNYSSWSLRPWLALRRGGVAFDETVVSLPDEGGGAPAFQAISPTGRVPVLHLGAVRIAESLAICEWAAEQAPALWPSDPIARARARSFAAIMHSGFPDLRREAPMNLRRRSDCGRMTEAGLRDARAMDALWQEELQASGGPFLFGDWSIADAMYAPAATRFETYAIPRSDSAARYIQAIFAEEAMAEWVRLAMMEATALARVDRA